MAFGFYNGAKAASNVSLAPNVAKDLNSSWLSQITVSVNGTSYLVGNTVINFSTVTGVSGLGSIALVAMEPTTHLIAGKNFSTSIANVTTTVGSTQSLTQAVLPYNAVSLEGVAAGQGSGTTGTTGTGGSGPVGGSSSSSNSLSLSATSLAVTGGPSTVFNLPAGSPGPSGPAYVAVVNNGDMVQNMISAGGTASFLQSQGFCNLPINGSTNIAFTEGTGSQRFDIFDVIDWSKNTDWIIVGCDSYCPVKVGNKSYNSVYDAAKDVGLANAGLVAQGFPASNFGNVVDNPNLSSTTPSIPFVFASDYPAVGKLTPLDNAKEAFALWIDYNRSYNKKAKAGKDGYDGLQRLASLDPASSLGGSPALYKKNANFNISWGTIRATGDYHQRFTIADAINIVDLCVLHDGDYVFWGEPTWMDKLMPVIANNYGYGYLPIAGNETRPNGYTAIEYTKAQVCCLFGGDGLSNNPPIMPSNPGTVWLPGVGSTTCSGMRYFNPYFTNGSLAHYRWPEPSNSPEFEKPGTLLQMLQTINIIANKGTFNANDPNYNAILNNLLSVVQKLNGSLTMDNLTTALGSTVIDLGQTGYLYYNAGTKQLVLQTTPPLNTSYSPPDGSTQSTYSVTYQITGGGGDQECPTNENQKTLVDTSVSSGVISYNGSTVQTAPSGDDGMHVVPYRAVRNTGNAVYACDSAVFISSSGAKNNNGTVILSETVGPSFRLGCIN